MMDKLYRQFHTRCIDKNLVQTFFLTLKDEMVVVFLKKTTNVVRLS